MRILKLALFEYLGSAKCSIIFLNFRNLKKVGNHWSLSYTRGGQLFSFVGHIGLFVVSGGPNSGQICFFTAKNEAFVGHMFPPLAIHVNASIPL